MPKGKEEKLSPEEIERNKDLMDLKPDLDYVIQHAHLYRAAISDLLARPIDEGAHERIGAIAVTHVTRDATLQLAPERALEVLAHLPGGLLQISGLTELDYCYQGFVPIPKFNERGFFDGCEGLVLADTFPDTIEDGTHKAYHPTRILIGNTDRGVIRPSFLPRTVCDNREAVEIYQIHVLLHEFFHTIEGRFRSPEMARTLRMRFENGSEMNFEEWRRAFIQSMLETEPLYTSRYAQTYADKITPGESLASYAVAEQLCETFVAYVLGRAPSESGYEDFRTFSFGNLHPEKQLIKGYGSIRHELMDKFFKARFEIG